MAGDAPGPGELAGRERRAGRAARRRSAALAGDGGLALLTGPPGIGKTRLAEELAGQAHQDGHQVLWGRAVEDQGAPPLWMWRRILGAVGGDDAWAQLTGEATAPGARSDELAAARYRAAAAAVDTIIAAADAGRLLVVLEDLHWADEASLFLLGELAAELPESRLLVLATARDGAGDPWRAALGDLARLAARRMLRLAALNEAALAAIMKAAGVTMTPALSRMVYARSGGNPLYVTTLARLLAREPGYPADERALSRFVGSSAEVSGLVQSLLHGLDDDAAAVLAAASVLGETLDPALVAAVGQTASEVSAALAAAEQRGLISPLLGQPGSWRFMHALIRDGIYGGSPRRSWPDGRAASVLEPLAAVDRDRGGEVAAHLLRAAPDRAAMQRAAGWASGAAAAATAGLAFEDAARYLATALAAAERGGVSDAERAVLLIELATAGVPGRTSSRREPAARGERREMPAERGRAADLVADAALVVRGVGHQSRSRQRCSGLRPRARRRKLPGGPAGPAARAASGRAGGARRADTQAGAESAASRCRGGWRPSDPVAELEAIRARVAALSGPAAQGRVAGPRQPCDRAWRQRRPAARSGARPTSGGSTPRISWLNLEAVDADPQIAQLAESTRLPLARWHLLRQQASRAALAGQFAVARDRSWEAHRLAVRLQDPSGAGLSIRSPFSSRPSVASPVTSRPTFCRVTAGASPAPPPVVRAGQALALYVLGRPDEARAVYETVRSLPGRGDTDSRNLGALSHILDLIIAFCDQDTALAAYDLMASHTADTGVTGTGVVFLSGSPHWPLGRGRSAGPHRGCAGAFRYGGDRQHPARRPPLRGARQAGLGRGAMRPRSAGRPG